MPTAQSGILPEGNTDALFLTLKIDQNKEHLTSIKRACAEVPTLTVQLSGKYPDAQLSSTISIGYSAWDLLYIDAKPTAFLPFQSVSEDGRASPETEGDLLLHIRSNRKDINFLLMNEILHLFGDSIQVIEETNGFRYLDNRDLTGFVDGTENPDGAHRADVALISNEDPEFSGGSYIHTQRYVHHLNQWEKQSVTDQEKIIGRTKEDNIEFDSEHKASVAHIKRVNLKDSEGKSMEILRHSMPYGNAREAGLYFISYCKTPRHFNEMLTAMICSDDQGHYDHLMNFTSPVSGCAYFAPSIEFLTQNS